MLLAKMTFMGTIAPTTTLVGTLLSSTSFSQEGLKLEHTRTLIYVGAFSGRLIKKLMCGISHTFIRVRQAL